MAHPVLLAENGAAIVIADAREKIDRYLVENDLSGGSIHPQISLFRDEAVDEIVRLVEAYQTTDDILVHAIILLNRLIAKMFKVPGHETRMALNLSAVGCFMLAIKFKEVAHPCIPDISKITKHSCEAICAAEQFVVVGLGWDINVNTGDSFCIFSVVLFYLLFNWALDDFLFGLCSYRLLQHLPRSGRLLRSAKAAKVPFLLGSDRVLLLGDATLLDAGDCFGGPAGRVYARKQLLSTVP